MAKPTHLAKLYVANAIPTDGGGWLAQWAAPGQIPRYVLDGDKPEIFDDEADAEYAAAICLVDALNARPRGNWKVDREFMDGAELSRLCGEIGIGPTDFALIFGSRQERVLDMFSGSREPPFSAWWALELFKTPSLLDKAKKIAREHTRPQSRDGGDDVG